MIRAWRSAGRGSRGHVVGTQLTTGSESRGTVSRRLRHGDRDPPARSSSKRAEAAGKQRTRTLTQQRGRAGAPRSQLVRREPLGTAGMAGCAGNAVRTRSPDLRQMHLRHFHGKMSPFNTRAHSANTLSRKKRATCIHAHMKAMRSVLRQHRSTCTNIRPADAHTTAHLSLCTVSRTRGAHQNQARACARIHALRTCVFVSLSRLCCLV